MNFSILVEGFLVNLTLNSWVFSEMSKAEKMVFGKKKSIFQNVSLPLPVLLRQESGNVQLMFLLPQRCIILILKEFAKKIQKSKPCSIVA